MESIFGDMFQSWREMAMTFPTMRAIKKTRIVLVFLELGVVIEISSDPWNESSFSALECQWEHVCNVFKFSFVFWGQWLRKDHCGTLCCSANKIIFFLCLFLHVLFHLPLFLCFLLLAILFSISESFAHLLWCEMRWGIEDPDMRIEGDAEVCLSVKICHNVLSLVWLEYQSTQGHLVNALLV